SPATDGLSTRAVSRARDILGGQKSDFFEWRGNRLQLAKVSLKAGRSGQKRGPGFMRGHSRTGYVNAKSGLRVSQLTK
ncbi:hypothetical protein, partial [Streptococcus pneumoniae]|uniref:hypothetical protein n=1 Tax=Streptococcus pneumoniae TaxID=1313 RepID=UPI0018B02F8B